MFDTKCLPGAHCHQGWMVGARITCRLFEVLFFFSFLQLQTSFTLELLLLFFNCRVVKDSFVCLVPNSGASSLQVELVIICLERRQMSPPPPPPPVWLCVSVCVCYTSISISVNCLSTCPPLPVSVSQCLCSLALPQRQADSGKWRANGGGGGRGGASVNFTWYRLHIKISRDHE